MFFLFFFSFFSSFFPLLFVVLRVPLPLPCSFFVRFGLSSCHLFVPCIVFFAFIFASPLFLVADSVILLFRLGATLPPALLASLSMRIPLERCLLPCLVDVDLFLFFLLLPFFDFDLFGHRLFHPVFF